MATIFGLILLANAVVCSVVFVKAHNADHTEPSFEEPVDALVVFYDRPSRFQRLDAAIVALRARTAEHLILVGGCRPGQGRFGAGDMAQYAKTAGVAPERIHIGRGSFDTRTNLSEALEIVRRNGWDAIAFVSDPLHLSRIQALASEDQYLSSISRGRALATAYGGGILEIVGRAQHEAVYWGLAAALPEQSLNWLIKAARTGARGDGPIRCEEGARP